MWFSFFFHFVGTASFCFDETAGSTYSGLLIHAKFSPLEK
jgi:hypothetical protein